MAGQMQFNGLTMRYNPRKIEIGCKKTVKLINLPFASPILQELSIRPRIIRGEGEFFGNDRDAQFAMLQAEFLLDGAGRLICPLCAPMNAYFTSLNVIGEAGAPILRYSFEFIESDSPQKGSYGTMVNGKAVFS
ncbi:MAG: hypothetical protein RSC64_00970 [Hydrogenoanaerobacterium sp.]